MAAPKHHNPGFLALVEDAKQRVKEITVAETAERLAWDPTCHLVDVREDSEWAQGHARGATHLSKGVIERDVEEKFPDKATPLILYCGGGFRSALAADNLQRMGYTAVLSMAGGWRAWKESGQPVEG